MKNNEENNHATGPLPPRGTRFNFSSGNNRVSTQPSQRDLPAHERATPEQPHLTGRKHQHTDKTGPLVFNLAQLLRDFEGAHRDYDFEQDVLALNLEEGEKPTQATNIHGRIRFTKIRGSVLTQGQGEADVVLECVRCLNDFEYHVDYDIEETFRPMIDITTGYPVKTESLDEESDLKLDANHLLNLGEAVRQQILVSLPINPVCGDDCPGFSSILDRVNAMESKIEDVAEEPAEEEDEEEEIVDPRWSALSKLLDNGKS